MAKTQRTDASVSDFLTTAGDPLRRADAPIIDALLREVTGEQPAMWGASIVGYGEYKSASGPWPRIGFSPRRGKTSIYLMAQGAELDALLARLGRHTMGAGCLYITRLEQVDTGVLREILEHSWAASLARDPSS